LGTPVIGLYAATNPQRAGPYRYREYVVNKYPEALEKYYDMTPENASWGKRIQNDECMALIESSEVTAMLTRIMENYSC
jgi:heptosyltransferase I